MFSQVAYDRYVENKLLPNSLYFHHDYAVADIPIGREYEAIAYGKNGMVEPGSIQKCPSKVLCFFMAFRTRPSDSAMRGHHELSQIEFEQGVPTIINKLFEITKGEQARPQEYMYIYLGSEETLKTLACEREKSR